MKLVIIYGSEAVGKLTIAKVLETKTDLKLFHNHVSIDVGKVLFEYGESAYNDLVWDVRDLVFERAAKYNLPGLIFTWAYSHPDFQPMLDRVKSLLNPYKPEIHYVFVHCSQSELEKRVVSDHRASAGKAHTIEALHKQQKNKNHQVIPETDSLEIDNTDVSPQEVADIIIKRFDLLSSQELRT